MKKVLLSTDFSENADHAIEYALALFEDEEIDYCLLNSYSLLHNIPETLISLEDILHEQSEKRLDTSLDLIKKNHDNLRIAGLSIYGDPPAAIKKVANDQSMDLVVLGCRGCSISDALYGSTTSSLIRAMDQPVLVVPVNHSGKAPKKIILATDLIQIDDLDVLDAMLAIARKFHAEVIIVNVTGGEERQKVQQAIHRLDFNNHFSGIKSRIEVVDHHDIVAGIRKYAHQQKADLLVVFPKHYPSFKSMFRKSITRNVVKHSDIPVLII